MLRIQIQPRAYPRWDAVKVIVHAVQISGTICYPLQGDAVPSRDPAFPESDRGLSFLLFPTAITVDI